MTVLCLYDLLLICETLFEITLIYEGCVPCAGRQSLLRQPDTLTIITVFRRPWALTIKIWQLIIGYVYGFNSRRWHFISVCNQPPRSTQPFILSRSINRVVSCNRMFASSQEWRRLLNAYGVKAWCG